jgi:hypothetical protein
MDSQEQTPQPDGTRSSEKPIHASQPTLTPHHHIHSGVRSNAVARRSPWLNDRATLLVKLLREDGLEISEDTARHDISEHVDYVATIMRIGRQAAKYYITDEVIAELANRIASAVQQHNTAIRQQQAVDLDAERRRRR